MGKSSMCATNGPFPVTILLHINAITNANASIL